jgi:hypothetical protein
MTSLSQSEIISALESANTRVEVVRILSQTTNYCECGSDDTIALLAEMLEILNERKHNDGILEYRQISTKVETLLMQCGRTGYGCWFVYTMEQLGWFSHGFNLFDLWITIQGLALLDALKRCPKE